MVSKRPAFTLIEVMVAVAILAFTATAAIKLVIMAQNGLSEARKQQALLDEARNIQIGVRTGRENDSGQSGDIAWETAEKKREIMGADFGRLDFDKSGDAEADAGFGEVTWRELTVRDTKDDAKIVLLMPMDGEARQKENTSDDLNTISDDKNSKKSKS